MHFSITHILTAFFLASTVHANIQEQQQQQRAAAPAIRRHHQRRIINDVIPQVEQELDPVEHLDDIQDLAPVEKRAKKCKNKKQHKDKSHKKHHHHKNKQSDSKLTQSGSGGSSKIFGGTGSGLMGLKFASSCQPDASKQHPNGAQSFLNCGVDSNGWNPPNVKLSQLKMLSGDEAAKSSLFSACKKNLWAFKQAEKSTGVPATLLMSFAMQESSCNPNEVGGNGEQGLMQITPDKCGGAPGGNCKDVGFNVNKGAQYFKSQLDDYNGNVLAAIGQYNGWTKGMTVGSATAAARHGNCHAQNNLDYLYQLLNGWVLGSSTDPYSMGKYQNLKNCN